MIELLRENPRRVVSFTTFTRASRRDTDRKVRAAIDDRAAEVEEAGFPRITTLHTLAKRVVHRYALASDGEANFSVLVEREGEKAILISEVIEDLGLAVEARALDKAVTHFRSTGQWPDEPQLSGSQRIQVIEVFESLLKFYNTFDMEGLVLTACDLLRRRAGDLPPVFLQVDEYQDLNPKDQELVALLSATPSSEVVVVGDDAQSIYGFRDAYPEGIRELWESEDWERVRFPKSLRLPPHVLRAAHSLIKDRGYVGTEIDVPQDDGRRVATLQCTDSKLQIKAVARCIEALLKTGRNSEGGPLDYNDFMVLCPTNKHVNQTAAVLQDKYGIQTKKRTDPIPRHVWELLLVLRMLSDADSLALRQWLEVAGLSALEIRRIRADALKSGRSLYEYCTTLPEERIQRVFAGLDRLWKGQVEADLFHQALQEFPCLAVDHDTAMLIDEIIEYLPSVGRMTTRVYERYGVVDAEGERYDIPEDDKVLVTTMHSAKGLEAEVVFIMWLNARFMPFPGRDAAEEERVFYVALTRAHQDVILTFHEEWDASTGRRVRDKAMSPFLRSIRNHLDIQPVRAETLKGDVVSSCPSSPK